MLDFAAVGRLTVVARHLSYRESQERKPCDEADLGVDFARRQHLERRRLGQQPAAPGNRLAALFPAAQSRSEQRNNNR